MIRPPAVAGGLARGGAALLDCQSSSRAIARAHPPGVIFLTKNPSLVRSKNWKPQFCASPIDLKITIPCMALRSFPLRSTSMLRPRNAKCYFFRPDSRLSRVINDLGHRQVRYEHIRRGQGAQTRYANVERRWIGPRCWKPRQY